MRIPCQSIVGAEPMMCVVNVAKRIKALGGRSVFGWEVRPMYLADVHTPHCVWESPDGHLQCVTPKYTGLCDEGAVVEWPETIEFVPDASLAWDGGKCPFDAKYVAKHLGLAKACEYMTTADRYMNAGDLDRCRYWTEKANREARKLGVYWDVPASLDNKDVLAAALS
jgi:hypothetical protein